MALLTLFLRNAKDLRRLTTTLHSAFLEADNVVLAGTLDIEALEPSEDTRESWALGKAAAALRPLLLSLASKRVPPRIEADEVKRLHVLRKFAPLKGHLSSEPTAKRIAEAFNEGMERDEAERELERAVGVLGLD